MSATCFTPCTYNPVGTSGSEWKPTCIVVTVVVITFSDGGDKYHDEEPDAFELFKECHYSKRKKGYTPAVQLAISKMENKISAPTEGEERPNSTTQAVADVLAEKTKKSQFLQNVGIQTTRPRSNAKDLEAQLEAEKREKNELARQLKVLSKQVEETEQGRIRDREEMKKKQADLEAKVELLLSRTQP
ncbi:hypothetical protein EJB05_26922, partial [Eragrostis curvula]